MLHSGNYSTHVEIIHSHILLEPKISYLDSSEQRTDFHQSNVHCSCFLAKESIFLLLVLQYEMTYQCTMVSLQQFDHEGLIHGVFSEQLMLRCVCFLNSVKNLFGLQFLRLVTLMNLSSAAEVTLGIPFLWRSS